jgi:D-proline reductase (dithiol) PrdB
MVRLSDLPEYESQRLLAKNMLPIDPPVWVPRTKPLSQVRFAIITTAGLHYRDNATFEFTDATFRPIDGREDTDNLIMSHSSLNFDRTGFAEDVNTVFPLDRFNELRLAGILGSVASIHYSFMGAGHLLTLLLEMFTLP